MISTTSFHAPLLSFHGHVRRKAELFGNKTSLIPFKYSPFILEVGFLILRYCDLLSRFRGESVYIPQGRRVPTGYRFRGYGLMELLAILASFDTNKAVQTLNEVWQFTPNVRQYPTREGYTFYPLSLEGFKDEFRSFTSMKFSDQQKVCARQGGRIITIEEFFDYLIDCIVRFNLPLKKIIQSMIPNISSIGVTDYIMVRCANNFGAMHRLHIILTRRGEIHIIERPSELLAPDIGTLCSSRMLL